MERLLCLALLLFGLNACGIPATATPGVLENGCGELTMMGSPPHPTDTKLAQAAGSCLADAYHACRATSLTIQQPDIHAVRQFTVVSGSRCTLRQALQTDPNEPPAIADCQNIAVTAEKIIIQGCSHLGDFELTP